MRFYGEIQRIDEEQRMVWGYASTEMRAMDGKVIRRAAMEGALDDYMAFANIREMHQLSAVGTAREAEVDEGGLYIGAHVVDDTAWNKVKSKVYRGFSIGAKVTEIDPTDPTIITGMLIREISLVDRPSDPGAVFDVWRAGSLDDETTIQEDDMSRAAPKPEAPASTPEPAPTTEAPAAIVERAEGESAAETAAAAAGDEAQAAEAAAASEEAAEADRAAEPAPEGAADEAAPSAAEEAVRSANAAIVALDAAVSGRTQDVTRAELPGMEIRRGMSSVSRLGCLLSELAYVVMDAQFESDIEGDNSPVPDLLRGALRSLADAYRTMSAEELAELLSSVAAGPALDQAYILFAAGDADLQRTADPISPELGARIQAIVDSLIARGWTPALAAADAVVVERDTLVRTVNEMAGKLTALTERLGRIEDAPAPPKTGGALARAVDKEEDAGGPGGQAAVVQPTNEDIQRALDAMPEDERALALIRAARALPIPISNRPSS